MLHPFLSGYVRMYAGFFDKKLLFKEIYKLLWNIKKLLRFLKIFYINITFFNCGPFSKQRRRKNPRYMTSDLPWSSLMTEAILPPWRLFEFGNTNCFVDPILEGKEETVTAVTLYFFGRGGGTFNNKGEILWIIKCHTKLFVCLFKYSWFHEIYHPTVHR